MAKGATTGLLQSRTSKGLPRPLRKGLFECEDKRTGAKTQKWVELYRDKFVFTKPARDSRAAFAPEAEVPLSAVQDLEIIEDGFEVKTTTKEIGTQVLVLRGPQPQREGELDLWFDVLARVFEGSELGFMDALPVQRPARGGQLANDLTHEVGTDDEAPGELETIPGEIPPRKLTGPSESDSVTSRNKLGLSSLTAKGIEKAICHGTFSHEIGQGAAVSDRLVELYKDRLILFQQAKDQRRAFRPDILLPLSEIEDVEPVEDGFELKRRDGEVDVFHGPSDGRLDPWLENLGRLLRQQETFGQPSRGLSHGSNASKNPVAGGGQTSGSVRFGTETTVREYQPSSSGSRSTLGDSAGSALAGGGGSPEQREETAESGSRSPCTRERVESLFDRYSALDDGEEADRSREVESIDNEGNAAALTPSSSSKASEANVGKTSTAGSAKSSELSKTGRTDKWPLVRRFGSIADFDDDEEDDGKDESRKGNGADICGAEANNPPIAEARPLVSRRSSSLMAEAKEAVQRARASTKASASSKASSKAASSKPSSRQSANVGGSADGGQTEFQGLSDDDLAELIAKALASQAAGEGEPPQGLAASLVMAAESFSSSEALSLEDICGRWTTNRGEHRNIDANGRVSCGDGTEDYYIEPLQLGDSKVLASPNGWFIDSRKSVPGILMVWQKPGRGRKEWRREDSGPRLALPKDATVRSWLSALKDSVVVQGPLSFQSRGKLVQRFAVLFKDRLDTWDHAPCSHHGHAPEGRMHVKDLRNIQIVGKGLLVTYRSRRLGIHTQSGQEAQAWYAALKAVCAGTGSKPQELAVYTKARKSLVAGLKDGSLIQILQDMEKKGEQASHCMKHVCKNHGLKQSGEIFAPAMRPVRITPKNPW